jgi:hypothetical protein
LYQLIPVIVSTIISQYSNAALGFRSLLTRFFGGLEEIQNNDYSNLGLCRVS